ncbi:unnamed protein product [Sphagnum troendelagicum]
MASSAASSEYHAHEIEGGSSNTAALPKSLMMMRSPLGSTTSMYDFVKVRVWLGENADHYYVLSRFLVSRMLLVTKIPNHVAVKISSELKMLLIDNSLLDVSQSDLEANLFKLMERRGYGTEYINRYKMMTMFHHQRLPLIILVCGTACVGKSTIATQLAQRLNLPNILQTDMVYELLRTSTDAPLASTPVWARDFASPEELVKEFNRECRIVQKGLEGDIKKAVKDGKPVIIEGLHLDPAIYLMGENTGAFGPGAVQMKAIPSRKFSEEVTIAVSEKNSKSPNEKSDDGTQDLNSLQSENSGKVVKLPENEASEMKASNRSSSTPPKCIVVPLVLNMSDVDHETLLGEWVEEETGKTLSLEEKEASIRKLQAIQDYVMSFESQGMTVVNVSATTFSKTMDWLHSYLLQCIERGCGDLQHNR